MCFSRRLGTSAGLLALALLAACGGNDPSGGPDATVGDDDTPDASQGDVDAAQDPDAAPSAGDIGDPCDALDDCLGDYCVPDADGWPDGYCVELDCDLGAPDTSCLAFGGDGVCLDTGDPGAPRGICFDTCDPAASDCRAGYSCETYGADSVCVPEAAPGTDPVGAPCTTDTCIGDFCIGEDQGWPGGYCTEYECDLGAPDTSCLEFGGDGVCYDVGDPGAPVGICLDRCDFAAPDCRTGYECSDLGGGLTVCVPGTPGTDPVGAACASDTCIGNLCITDTGWPDGYCTQTDCDLGAPDTSCLAYGGDGYCYDFGDPGSPFGACLDTCDPAAPDCRTGYECVDLGTGVAVCVPGAPAGDPVGTACADETTCSGNYCILDADGWPAGYCTQTDCDLAAPDSSCLAYGGDGYCYDFGDPGSPFGVCLDQCDLAAPDCRSGYDCFDVGLGTGTGVCAPPAPAGTDPIGAACVDGSTCASSGCIDESQGWPGGYCAAGGCDLGAPDTSCLAYGGDGVCVDDGGGGSICLDSCVNTADCRSPGYTCQSYDGQRVCLP